MRLEEHHPYRNFITYLNYGLHTVEIENSTKISGETNNFR